MSRVVLLVACLGVACGGADQPPPVQLPPVQASSAAVTNTWPRGMLWYLDANQAVVSTLPGLWRDPASLYLWEIDENTAVVHGQTGTFRFMYTTGNCTGTAYIGPTLPHVSMPFQVETEGGSYRVRGDQVASVAVSIQSALTSGGCVAASASRVVPAAEVPINGVTPIPQPFRAPLHISEIGQPF